MPGLVPGIHVFRAVVRKEDVDGRAKPGHDGERGGAQTKAAGSFDPAASNFDPPI